MITYIKTGKMFKAFIAFGVLFLINFSAKAQCAMCRATVENNVSDGDVGLASNLNFGILYLFLAPYILVAVIAFFWYRNSKLNYGRKFKTA